MPGWLPTAAGQRLPTWWCPPSSRDCPWIPPRWRLQQECFAVWQVTHTAGIGGPVTRVRKYSQANSPSALRRAQFSRRLEPTMTSIPMYAGTFVRGVLRQSSHHSASRGSGSAAASVICVEICVLAGEYYYRGQIPGNDVRILVLLEKRNA